mmetsp:Transcript_71989/g.186962  ORF Transcript_71989/g.186962 Transcript_71989/m.186962 type:complete len:100 (-) Transcript_71989:349-648(-)
MLSQILPRTKGASASQLLAMCLRVHHQVLIQFLEPVRIVRQLHLLQTWRPRLALLLQIMPNAMWLPRTTSATACRMLCLFVLCVMQGSSGDESLIDPML